MTLPQQFRWLENRGIQFLEVSQWNDHYPVFAGFSTRIGGYSNSIYSGLQMGLHVGDTDHTVIQNRQLLSQAAGTTLNCWVASEQIHGGDVEIVTKNDRGKGSLSKDTAIAGKDALVTAEKNVVLTTFAADCVPLLFYSSEGVVAVAHAGWRGTVKKIAANTVQTMHSSFGCAISDIQVAIGPSIGACCYEVDKVVYQAFADIGLANSCCQPLESVKSDLQKHWMCDLWQANKEILIETGILEANIYISRLCTSCHTDLFYSHRKENGKTGRLMGMIYIT